MTRHLHIIAEHLTPRLRYIFTLLLGERLGLTLTFAESGSEGISGPAIHYGMEPMPEVPSFTAHGLLSEQGIRPLEIVVKKGEARHVLPFVVAQDSGLLPFDPFAAAFYLVTRYEEYLPYTADRFGRYPSQQSLAVIHGFADEPVVDRWVFLLRDVLLHHFPELECGRPEYRFTSTIDIDNAFAYRHKGLLMNIGGAVRDLMTGTVPTERLSVLAGMRPDPYDTYKFLKGAHERAGIRPILFWLLADRGPYDRNLPHTCHAMRSLISEVATETNTGIHPGFASQDEPATVRKEVQRLQNITGQRVTASRQHYLRMRMPDTYRTLIKCGITDDYTMGYADRTGFRAGTSNSFLWYDLGREEATTLRIHPFACMDVTLKDYLMLQPDEAIAEVAALNRRIREVGGHMMTLWHNESVSDRGSWTGWRRVFEETLILAATHEKP